MGNYRTKCILEGLFPILESKMTFEYLINLLCIYILKIEVPFAEMIYDYHVLPFSTIAQRKEQHVRQGS